MEGEEGTGEVRIRLEGSERGTTLIRRRRWRRRRKEMEKEKNEKEMEMEKEKEMEMEMETDGMGVLDESSSDVWRRRSEERDHTRA